MYRSFPQPFNTMLTCSATASRPSTVTSDPSKP
jgi:hypothetical protein